MQLVMILLILLNVAWARTGTGGCSGNHLGNKIIVNAAMTDTRVIESGTGSVTINDRVVSQFSGSDLKINIFARTFELTNGQGDSAKGKLTNLWAKEGIIYHLKIPAYGISYQNFKMTCWTKKE